MAYTVKFENGYSVDFDREPTPDDIEEVAAQFAPQQPQKPEAPAQAPGMLGEIGRGIARGIPKAGATILGGVDFLAGGLANAFGDQESADAAFRQMEERNRSLDMFNEENLPISTTAGKVAQGVTTAIPMLANPGLAMAGMSGMTGEQFQGLTDQGVDAQTGKKVAYAQLFANLIMSRIGLGAGGSYLREITANLGAGGAANWLSEQFLKSGGYDEQAAQFDPLAAENWLVDFLAAAAGTRAQRGAKAAAASKKVDPTVAKADEILKRQQPVEEAVEAPAPLEMPTKQGDLPLDIQQGIDTTGVRNPYDQGGDVLRSRQGLDTTLESQQGDLFSPEGTPLRPEVFDEPKTMESLAKPDEGVSDAFLRAFGKRQGGWVDPFGTRDRGRSEGEANRQLGERARPGFQTREGQSVSDWAAKQREDAARRALRKKQGGYIDPTLFDSAVEKVKELADGLTMRARTDPQNQTLIVEVLRNGEKTGAGAVFTPTKGLGGLEANNLQANAVGVPEAMRGQRLSQEIYKFASEMGADIQPSGLRTVGGHAMWSQFHKSGLAKNDLIQRPYDPKTFAKVTKQGGGINLNDITNGLSDIYKRASEVVKKPSKSDSELAVPEKQAAAYAKIPGLEGMLERVSKDIPIAKIKETILGHAPLENSMHGAIGGKEMIASIKNHPAIYWVGSMFTNARKRSDLYHNEYIKPLEKAVLKLTQGDRAGILASILKSEMFAKQKMDDAGLREMGLNDKEMALYKNFRTEFDRALDRVNEYRLADGQDPITPHEAYMASRWRGDWKTPVYDTKGRLVWYIAETSKAKAEHALKWLAENEPEIDVKKSDVKYSKDFFLSEESMNLATYKDMVKMLGTDDPLVVHLEKLYSDKVKAEAEGTLGHKRHFEPKAGVRGFLGDRPWANSKENVNDLFKSQLAYLRNAHTWVEMQSAMRNANEVIGDKSIIEHDPKLVELLQDIKRNEMGYATNRGISYLERSASKYASHGVAALSKLFPPLRNLPTDLQSVNTGLGWAKSYFYLTRLGLYNIPFATMSIVQPVFTTPHHVQLSFEGYSHNPIKTWAEGVGLGSKIFFELATNRKTSLKGRDRAALEYMKANGIGDLNQYSEAHDIGLSPVAKKVKDIGGMSMTESERYARSVAFLSYVSHLDQSGKFKDNQHAMFQKAEELTNKSMANYRHTERAGMFNKTGFVGNAAATLQTFKINQWNQLYDFYKTAKRTGNWKPLSTMLGMQFLMAGALGMYAVDEMEDLYNLFKRGAIEAGVSDPDFIEWSPKHAMAKHLKEWASYGLFSKTLGEDRNFGTRMSQANVVDLSFLGAFPFAADYARQITAAATAAKNYVTGQGTKRDIGKVVSASAPSSVKNYLTTLPELGLVDEEGNPYDSTGKGLAYRRDEDDRRTMEQIPPYSMQSVKEHKTREENFRFKQANALKGRAKEIQLSKLEVAVGNEDGKAAARAITNYVGLGGNVRDVFSRLETAPVRKKFTEEEWEILKAKGTDGLRRVIERMEYTGVH